VAASVGEVDFENGGLGLLQGLGDSRAVEKRVTRAFGGDLRGFLSAAGTGNSVADHHHVCTAEAEEIFIARVAEAAIADARELRRNGDLKMIPGSSAAPESALGAVSFCVDGFTGCSTTGAAIF
jgi:hypothetical protein